MTVYEIRGAPSKEAIAIVDSQWHGIYVLEGYGPEEWPSEIKAENPVAYAAPTGDGPQPVRTRRLDAGPRPPGSRHDWFELLPAVFVVGAVVPLLVGGVHA